MARPKKTGSADKAPVEKKETALVKMKRSDGHTADVHPDMVEDYRKGGYERA